MMHVLEARAAARPSTGDGTLDWDHHALREPSARAGTPSEGWRERGGRRAGTSCDVLPPRRHVQALREIDPRDDGARAVLASLTMAPYSLR